MNRQEELLREKGEEVGDGTAEGLSAIGDRGQTVISFTPDVDGIRSASLLDSILSTLLKRMIQVLSGW